MSDIDNARNAINAAIQALQDRRAATTSADEKQSINDAIVDLQAQRGELNEQALADAAHAVADATGSMQGAVEAAQAGPFDAHIAALTTGLGGLQAAQARLFAPIRLARTDDPAIPAPAAPPRAQPEEVAVAPGLPPVGAGHDPAQLAAEYKACFDACVPSPDRAKTIQWYSGNVVKSRTVYQSVGGPLGIPWYFVGVIHGMECGFNFGTHLHNGDPLNARTVQVPKGRPTAGNPPFAWSVSATDALTYEGFANQADWTLPMLLFRLEKYNGFGYRRQGLRTPYLWSFSNLYVSGKYVADGVFSATAVSDQCGAAVMLKALVAGGALALAADGTLA